MAHWGGGYLSSVPNCKLNGNLGWLFFLGQKAEETG